MFSKQEIQSSNLKELQKELLSARGKDQQTRIGVKTSHLKDTSSVGKQKRYIARLLTQINLLKKEESKKVNATQAEVSAKAA